MRCVGAWMRVRPVRVRAGAWRRPRSLRWLGGDRPPHREELRAHVGDLVDRVCRTVPASGFARRRARQRQGERGGGGSRGLNAERGDGADRGRHADTRNARARAKSPNLGYDLANSSPRVRKSLRANPAYLGKKLEPRSRQELEGLSSRFSGPAARRARCR